MHKQELLFDDHDTSMFGVLIDLEVAKNKLLKANLHYLKEPQDPKGKEELKRLKEYLAKFP